jgi:glycosyltransferase involved in cell wall biosynthesis
VIIAYFGFVTPLKGFDVLLRVVQALRKEGLPIKLLLITRLDPIQDGYHREMTTLMQTLAIRDICLLGDSYYTSQDVSYYLQIADLALLPFSEGASERRGSLLAALQHRLPTITTDGPNMPSDFVDRQNMILVPPGDVDAMLKAVKRLVEKPDYMKQLAAEAGELSRMFSWDEIAQETIKSYRQIQRRDL